MIERAIYAIGGAIVGAAGYYGVSKLFGGSSRKTRNRSNEKNARRKARRAVAMLKRAAEAGSKAKATKLVASLKAHGNQVSS